MMKIIKSRLLFARGFSSQLFISRLSFYTTDQQLKTLFSPFGELTQARLVKDPITQRPKGFAFVTYKTDDQAQKAIDALNGRILSVSKP
ncbi:hypothetical protein ACHQM5_009772 [Ranunculus cassubicifolius]